MNDQIHCITNEGKTSKNIWENEDCDFLVALYSVYKKLGQFFSHTLIANLLKQRYISSATSYKYSNKVISEKKNICLSFFENTMYMRIIPLIKL